MSYKRNNVNPVIYKITSPTNKIYIGQTWDYIERFKNYRTLKCKGQKKLYSSLKKYGTSNHKLEIIIELDKNIDQLILDENEIKYWKQYINDGYKMLNLREPGKGGKMSKETIIKMKKAQLKRAKNSDYSSISKEVHQYEINGKYIKSFKSLSEAKKMTGAKAICEVVNNKPHYLSSGGYRWSYSKVDYLDEYVNNSSKSRRIYLDSLKHKHDIC